MSFSVVANGKFTIELLHLNIKFGSVLVVELVAAQVWVHQWIEQLLELICRRNGLNSVLDESLIHVSEDELTLKVLLVLLLHSLINLSNQNTLLNNLLCFVGVNAQLLDSRINLLFHHNQEVTDNSFSFQLFVLDVVKDSVEHAYWNVVFVCKRYVFKVRLLIFNLELLSDVQCPDFLKDFYVFFVVFSRHLFGNDPLWDFSEDDVLFFSAFVFLGV